jgi:ribosome recycling factor
MQDARLAAFKTAAEKVLAHLHNEYSKLQTGRANAASVEHVMVDAYGQKVDLRSVAGISIDNRTIVIQPWDRGVMQAVEKALEQANIGANPVNDGVVIRITLPQMTEERRKQLSKIVHQLAEDARIALRKDRQGILDLIKAEADEDVKETLTKDLQKFVDEYNGKIADSAKKKEQEIMTV